MIKKFCFAAMAAVAAVGCCEKSVELPKYEENEELVTFSVSVPGLETRSQGTVDERVVNNLQVVVFNARGVYETTSFSASNSVDLTCTAGEKRIVAIVNASKEKNIVDYADLAGRMVYLADSGEADLVMVGDTTVTVAADSPIDLEVSYISSKIILTSVSLNLENQQHKDLQFYLKYIYLTNVAGDRKYIDDSTPSVWYHQGHYENQNTLPFIYDQVAEGRLVSGQDPYDIQHYFYCYPNSTSNKTRLVIEAEIEGETYYYPIVLDEVLANNQYSYSVVLTRLGVDSPDADLEKGSYSLAVTMKDWTKNSSVVEI